MKERPYILTSHQWIYYDEYNALKNKFLGLNWRCWEHDLPIDIDIKNEKLVEYELKQQFQIANCFIVFARMPIINIEWVFKEVEFAKEYGKYILGIVPSNRPGNIPPLIQDACNEIVRFDIPAIVKKIELALS